MSMMSVRHVGRWAPYQRLRQPTIPEVYRRARVGNLNSIRASTKEELKLRARQQNMVNVTFGATRRRLRPTTINAGSRSVAKRVRSMCESTIYNMTQANELDVGNGKNFMKFVKATGELPVWLCDLTTFNNVVKYSTHPTGSAYTAKPWWKLVLSQSGTSQFDPVAAQYNAPHFENLNYTYSLEDSPGGEAPSFRRNGRLEWIDFRGLFYGVNKRDTDWEISLIQFKDDNLVPVPTDPVATLDAEDSRLFFWMNLARQMTANPIVPQIGRNKRPFRYLFKERIHIPAKSDDVASLNSVQKKVFARLNKQLNYGWRKTNNVPTGTDGKVASMDDPGTYPGQVATVDPLLHPRSRVYLMLRATCPIAAEEGADTLYEKVQAFYQKDDVRMALSESGAGITITEAAGQAAHSLQMLPVTYASADNAGSGAGNSAYAGNFAYIKTIDGAAVTNGTQLGQDNPSFDFVLRAKITYPA